MNSIDSKSQINRMVTILLMVYNQEKYISEAVRSVLNQDYGSLEVIISDDCSTDSTWSIIEECVSGYRGPHSLVLNRNKKNLGLIGHLNLLNSLASGDLIVYAAGDDISLPNRVSLHAACFYSDPERVCTIHSPVYKLDANGRCHGVWEPRFKSSELNAVESVYLLGKEFANVIGATHSWSKRMMDFYGPITNDNVYEDSVIYFRSALFGGVRYINEPLVKYRYGVGISTKLDADVSAYDKYLIRKKKAFNRMNAAHQRRIDHGVFSGGARSISLLFIYWKYKLKYKYFSLALSIAG